jgi:penicillin-binding protein 1A
LSKRRKPTPLKKVFINTFLLLFTAFICGVIFLIILSRDLPSLEELRKFNPETISKIMSSDNHLLKELYVQKRDVIPLGKMPHNLINAVLSMEDRDFYEHSGVDIKGIFRAIFIDVITLSTRQGASTLTQQLARNMYNTIGFKKTITRKLKELLTAIQIEKTFTKSEIMELYLNSVYFGHGLYGVQSASLFYFGCEAKDLSLAESATIIGMLPAPAYYSPINHPEKAKLRKKIVLRSMNQVGYITDKQNEIALAENIISEKGTVNSGLAPYFSEHVRRELEKIDEELNINLYEDGLVIHTTLDMEIQSILEKAFDEGMERNQNVLQNEFINSPKKLKKALSKTGFSKDSILTIFKENRPIPNEIKNQFLVQGAAVVIDVKTGKVLAMIGGRNEKEYRDHFNRATQAKRQPGSVFKPFIYLSALEKGIPPTKQILNQPLVVFIDDTVRWNPQNHDGSTSMLETMRYGIKRSLNLISVRIVDELVTPNEIKKNAELFGLTTNIRAVKSIALGVSEVYPLEITLAYSAIGNNGILNKPLFIESIENRYGRVLREFIPDSKEVKNEDVIYIIRDMMRSVIDEGTGGSIRWKYKFNRPLAGKTGTTNGKTDAWFVGYTPQIAIGVWVGLDDPSVSLGEKQYGSSAALPIFANTIREIYNKKEWEIEDWEMPDGVIELEICSETYDKPTRYCPLTKEIFLKDYKPKKICSQHKSAFDRFKSKK